MEYRNLYLARPLNSHGRTEGPIAKQLSEQAIERGGTVEFQSNQEDEAFDGRKPGALKKG